MSKLALVNYVQEEKRFTEEIKEVNSSYYPGLIGGGYDGKHAHHYICTCDTTIEQARKNMRNHITHQLKLWKRRNEKAKEKENYSKAVEKSYLSYIKLYDEMLSKYDMKYKRGGKLR